MKYKWDYDNEFDDLFIYKDGKKSDGSIELDDDLLLDFTNDGEFTAMEFMKATEYLSDLTGEKITKEQLMSITECEITEVRKRGKLILRMVMLFKDRAALKTAVTAPIARERAVNYA